MKLKQTLDQLYGTTTVFLLINVKFAHISVFVTREMTQVDYPPETQLYLPITDGTPIIVDGYVVGVGVNEFGFDYTRFQWIPSRIKELE